MIDKIAIIALFGVTIIGCAWMLAFLIYGGSREIATYYVGKISHADAEDRDCMSELIGFGYMSFMAISAALALTLGHLRLIDPNAESDLLFIVAIAATTAPFAAFYYGRASIQFFYPEARFKNWRALELVHAGPERQPCRWLNLLLSS